MAIQESIPNYITAGSPKGLRVKMLQTAARLGAFVIFQDIQYVVTEKKWYAWYTPPINNPEKIDDLFTEETTT